MVIIVKPKYTVLTEVKGFDVLRSIEEIGRTAYQSESKLVDLFHEMSLDNTKKNLDVIEKRIKEAETLYNRYGRDYVTDCPLHSNDLYSKVLYTSAILFVNNLIKNGHFSVIEHKSISVRIVCDRGVSHETVRHRIASFTQESTRYCNYSNNKFGNQITVIEPSFFKNGVTNVSYPIPKIVGNEVKWYNVTDKLLVWLNAMEMAEFHYMLLLTMGSTPQEARTVLPNSLKTEIVITANLREWRESIFKLRTSAKAHPQMQEIMKPLLAEMQRKIPIIFDDIN